MTEAEVVEKIKEIIVEKLKISEEEISPEKSFTTDLGADSLDTVELVMELEDKFELGEIPDEEAEKLQTVGAVIDYVKEKKGIS